MSLAKIDAIIEALRFERYRWTPVRRTYISKKNGKVRPLGIPTWSDKLLQEVIRLILEAYYEPQFSDRSYGFRAGCGCHSALWELQDEWMGTAWFIEGDIAQCFDSFDHDVMLTILREKLHDGRFLRLIENLLRAGYLEDWQFHLLWNEVVWVHMKWQEFETLYAHSADSIGFLNELAPTFFWQLQDMMWRDVLLHIARLVDPSESMGNKSKRNLTLRGLPALILDDSLQGAVQGLVDDADDKAAFARDRRNRHIAHSDLAVKLNQSATPMAVASRLHVNTVLTAFDRVINCVERGYREPETTFSHIPLHGGSDALLVWLKLGWEARQARRRGWNAPET